MENENTFARAMHDVGLGAWFGGSLMGAIGLNAAAAEVDDPRQRSRVANAGWARWTPANLAAIAAYLVGGAILTSENKGRMVGQKGVAGLSAAKTAVTLLALAATAYSRGLGQRIMDAGDVPVEGGTSPSVLTPPEVANAQRQLRMLQWAIPAHVGALIVISSKMGEQQRPTQVAKGVGRRLLGRAA